MGWLSSLVVQDFVHQQYQHWHVSWILILLIDSLLNIFASRFWPLCSASFRPKSWCPKGKNSRIMVKVIAIKGYWEWRTNSGWLVTFCISSRVPVLRTRDKLCVSFIFLFQFVFCHWNLTASPWLDGTAADSWSFNQHGSRCEFLKFDEFVCFF